MDPETGGITYRPGMIPEMGVEIHMCPSTSGFKSWRAMAYSPQTRALSIPIPLNRERVTFGPTEQILGGGGTGPVQEDRSLDELFTTIRTQMPTNAPNSLPTRSYLGILACILEANGFPAGASELRADAAALSELLITASR